MIDPKRLATHYVFDALGRLTQQTSPDSGTTGYAYDDAGNRESKTDARSITANYTYDVLNRPLTITFPTVAENVSYLYDVSNTVCQAGETFATGRLSKLTDQSGTTEFCYDRFGNIARKVQTVGTQVQVVRYGFDKSNQLASLTYPDGTVADYIRDTQGRVKEVGVTPTGGTRQILLKNAKYLPDGPASSWQYGNNRTLTRAFDLDYRSTSVRDPGAGGLDIGYVYDSASYLKQVTTQSSSVVRAKFEYDALGRLKARRNAADELREEYAYDKTGNRTSAGEWYTVPAPNGPPGGGGTIDQFLTSNYTYADESHRLTQVGSTPRSYDGAGNLLVIGNKNAPGGSYDKEFFYNDANRLKQVNTGSSSTTTVLATYLYNGLGEQVQRQTSVTTRFVYDEGGQLLGQYDANGTPIQQYVWVEGQPVGVIVPPPPPTRGELPGPPSLWYAQSDALGSPRAIIDPVRNLAVWRWDEMKEGFGDHAPQTDPDNDGVHVVFDLRFPGQRFDAASGLYYNYFRDYDPSTGRYVQSDPIGLSGGISTYGYVGGNPMTRTDPMGLACRSSGGITRCDYPGGPSFRLPTPAGWEDFDGSEWLYYHYDVKRKLGCADAKGVMQDLINHPTPSPEARPATSSGTKKNNAGVPYLPISNFVTTYLTTDLRTGNPLVVNITAQGSFFDPGYVARAVTNGVAHTYGEGMNFVQQDKSSSGEVVNWMVNELIWGDQMQKFIDNNSVGCGCP